MADDCRVFATQSIGDFVKTICGVFGIPMIEPDIHGPAWHTPTYIQQEESYLSAMCRMLEDAGVTYWFDHSAVGAEQLGITDNPKRHFWKKPVELTWRPGNDDTREPDSLLAWSEQVESVPLTVEVNSHNWRQPENNLRSVDSYANPSACPGLMRYFWERYRPQFDSTRTRHLRAEQIQCMANVLHGLTNSLKIAPGTRFQIVPANAEDELPVSNMGDTFVVLFASHDARNSEGAESHGFQSEFLAIPATTQIRPIRRTPIHPGNRCLVGTIVDSSGNADAQSKGTVVIDNDGCVFVRFNWQRQPAQQANSGELSVESISARLMQPWSGNGWGAWFVPRVGDEVVVMISDYEPHDAIVLGGLYDGVNGKPFAQLATDSGIKSCVQKQPNQCTAIRFCDSGDEQRLELMSSKDLVTNVDRDQHLTIAGEYREQIGLDKHVTIGGCIHQEVGSFGLQCKGDLHIKAANILFEATHCEIRATGNSSVRGKKIYLNCKKSKPLKRMTVKPKKPKM